MVWDYDERRKRERNYRLMFKTALAGFALGVAVTLAGLVNAALSSDTTLVIGGLMMVLWSGVSAYLTVDSTVRIIEQDMEEGWGSR